MKILKSNKKSHFLGVLVKTYWPSTTRRILGTSGIVNGDVHTHTLIKRLTLKAFSPKYMHNYTPIIKLGIINHLKVSKLIKCG